MSTCNRQLQELEGYFVELKRRAPDVPSFRLLGALVMMGHFSAFNIRRAVNHLVDKADYCNDSDCRGDSAGCYPHDSQTLKSILCDLAVPKEILKDWRPHAERPEEERRSPLDRIITNN